MNVGSLFTGVGGFDLGFERAGMRIVFQCEQDEWCRGILAQHWPDVPCYPDVCEVGHAGRREDHGAGIGAGSDRLADGLGGLPSSVDLLCGGFPCQDLSVAGKRAGLDGARSGLFFEFARIAEELVRPAGWIVVENVPGLLSSAGGRDFAVLLRTLGDIGFHDLAWRVLDSRYFGVPQRRRRVFIVGRRAAGSGAREVLLEPESGGGNHSPGSEARPRVAASLSRGSSGPGVSAPGRRQEDDENIVNALDTKRGGADDNDAQARHLIAGTVRSHVRPGSNDSGGIVTHTLRAEGFDASEDGTGRGTPLTVAAPLVSRSSRGKPTPLAPGHNTDGHIVSTAPNAHGVRTSSGLPGWVDDPRPDGPRYSAMGNAVTVNVLEWIGERIMSYEESR